MRAILFSIILCLTLAVTNPGPRPASIRIVSPTPESITKQLQSEARQLEYDQAENTAARVMRAHGCSDEYAETVGHSAVDLNVPARIVSALIVVESTCRPNVVSHEGAVGLMQIMPKVWHVKASQLKDPEFNIRKGTEILASYTSKHGLREGLHRYNGLGVGCSACDTSYSDRVMHIAGYRI